MSDESGHTDYRSRDYPVREDMAHQVKVWRFERWGWYVLVLWVVLALLGLFSRGPLIAIDVGLSLLKQRSQWVSQLIDGGPTIIVENGKLLHKRLRHARLIEADVMEAARSSQGIETNQALRCTCCTASSFFAGKPGSYSESGAAVYLLYRVIVLRRQAWLLQGPGVALTQVRHSKHRLAASDPIPLARDVAGLIRRQ